MNDQSGMEGNNGALAGVPFPPITLRASSLPLSVPLEHLATQARNDEAALFHGSLQNIFVCVVVCIQSFRTIESHNETAKRLNGWKW